MIGRDGHRRGRSAGTRSDSSRDPHQLADSGSRGSAIPPHPPRSPEAPILTLGTAVLLPLLTTLAAIAGWAGLYAWHLPTPRYAGPLGQVEMPAPVEVTALQFPNAPARAVPASVRLVSGAEQLTGEVHVAVGGAGAGEVVTILDGTTSGVPAQAPVPAEGEVTFSAIPAGKHVAYVHARSTPPRRGYRARGTVELPENVSPRQTSITLDATAQDTVLLVERTDLPTEPAWHAATAVLHRVDDPGFCAFPIEGAARSFGPGSADVVFEFEALGPGRYRVAFDGSEPAEPVEFEVPGAALQYASGATRRLTTRR